MGPNWAEFGPQIGKKSAKIDKNRRFSPNFVKFRQIFVVFGSILGQIFANSGSADSRRSPIWSRFWAIAGSECNTLIASHMLDLGRYGSQIFSTQAVTSTYPATSLDSPTYSRDCPEFALPTVNNPYPMHRRFFVLPFIHSAASPLSTSTWHETPDPTLKPPDKARWWPQVRS